MQENVSWGIGYLILAITMGLSAFVFVLGKPFYRYKTTHGSPLTPLFHALVAAIRNRHLPLPSSPSLLYEDPKSEMFKGQLLGHTNRLRFLDKAAITEQEGNVATKKKQINAWRLATVTQVEELKLMIAMLPMWLTSLMFGIGSALGPTFFIKQGSAMNRKFFKHFEIPPPFLGIFISRRDDYFSNLVRQGARPILKKSDRQ
ncbi:Protein NRT1/ PTR FAMILY 5.6 [Bienertia sinuspersici]